MNRFIMAAVAALTMAFTAAPAVAADTLTLTYDGTVAGSTNGGSFGGLTQFIGITDTDDVADSAFTFSSFTINFDGTLYTVPNATATFANNALSIFGNGSLVTSFSFLTPYQGDMNATFDVELGAGAPFAVIPNIGSSQITGGFGILTSATSPMTAAVPEPATWAMMLIGFGAIGFSVRRKRQVTLLQAA